jgi:hypothetical protein
VSNLLPEHLKDDTLTLDISVAPLQTVICPSFVYTAVAEFLCPFKATARIIHHPPVSNN